jgi:hypothetical protein
LLVVIAVTKPTKSGHLRANCRLGGLKYQAINKQGLFGGDCCSVWSFHEKERPTLFTDGNGANGSLRAIFDG